MIRKNPEHLTDEDVSELAESCTEGWPMVSVSDLPAIDDYREDEGYRSLEGKVSPERYDQLELGDDPTREEWKIYLDSWREGLFDMKYDMDVIPTAGIASFQSANGQPLYAVVCGRGYSFTQVIRSLVGVFGTEQEARDYIENHINEVFSNT